MIRNKIEFNILENEILERLKDLKEVFKDISKRELLFHCYEMNYEIILKIEKIKSSLLIFIRLKK